MQLNLPGQFHTEGDVTKGWILHRIESLNKFMPSMTAHKRGGLKTIAINWEQYKNNWKRSLSVFFPKKNRKEGRVNVTIISDRVRLLDVENLYGGAKPIRDALEANGWLWNDSPKWGELSITQRRVKKGEEKTWIKLELDN